MSDRPQFKENSWTCPGCSKDPYENKADCVSLSLGDQSVCWCSCGAVSVEDVKDGRGFTKIVYDFHRRGRAG